MMAKMFYTLDETKSALSKNEEEIKQFAREGRLREYRDGAKLMFKADQVEALKNELGLGSPSPDLGPSDSGGPIGLVDSRTGSASSISLVDTDLGGGRSGSGAGMQLKDDTALAQDLGMTESVGGVPSPGRPGSGSSQLAGTRGGSGINVLGDSAVPADPMAQTAISGGGSMTDQVSLEGVGSGSGLLDLTRESDDTSLGAELLDEIAPGGTKRGSKTGSALTGSGTGSSVSAGTAAGGSAVGAPAVGRKAAAGPVTIEGPDATASAIGGAALGAALVVLFGGFAIASGVMDTQPKLLAQVAQFGTLIIAGGGLGVAVLFGIIGGIVGKSVK